MIQIVKRLVGWASTALVAGLLMMGWTRRPRRAAVPAGDPDDGNPDSSFKELVKGTVYELYAPSDSDPAVDVVFFHGLQLGDGSLAWRKTWESEIDGRKVCWPAELLPADLPGARVLTLCYDTAARSLPDQGRFDVEDLGTFTFSALRQAGVGERPLLLVGHSLGGLVLKQVLLHVDERAGKAADPAEKTVAKTFLGNVLGMAFYSTPHAGARLADYANALMSGVLRAVATPGPVMPYLCTLSKKAFRVNAPFQDLRRREGWITLGFCEMQATKAGPFDAVVVEQASGLQDMDARELINADHGGVCKPTSATDLPYSVLKSYIEERLRERDEVWKPVKQRMRQNELVGRTTEISTLLPALHNSKIVSIWGGAGEGKSRLAYELVAKLHESGVQYDKIIIAELGGGEWRGKGSAMKELISRIVGRDVPEHEVGCHVTARTIIVYNDTEDAINGGTSCRQALYSLIGLLHSTGAYQVITSRERLAQGDGAAPAHVGCQLGSLPFEDAKELLKSKCVPLSDADAKDIAEALHRNALLLLLVGGFLRDGKIKPKDVKQQGWRTGGDHREESDLVRGIEFFLRRCCDETDQAWLAEMSLWDSFTSQQARVDGKHLDVLVGRSILQGAGDGRYCMHVLVRDAAILLLAELIGAPNKFYFPKNSSEPTLDLRLRTDDAAKLGVKEVQQLEAARCHLVGSMAAVGAQAARAAAEAEGAGVLAAAAVLRPELGNCRRFCRIGDGLVNNEEFMRDVFDLFSKLTDCGMVAEAFAVIEQTSAVRRRVLGAEHPDTLRSMSHLASTLQTQGRHAEAEALHTEALDVQQHVLGAEHPDTLGSMNNLANTLQEQGRHAEAEALHTKALDVRRRMLGAEHPDTLSSMNNLAVMLRAQGRHAEAEALHKEALDVQRRVLGAEHPHTLHSMHNLANTLPELGGHAEAEALHREALDVQRRVLGAEHPDTLSSMNNLATTLPEQGRHAEAEALHREALDVQRRVLGAEHPHTLHSMNNLAVMLRAQGRHAEAEALHREALNVRRRVLGAEHPDTLSSMNNLAVMLWAQGRHAKAEALHREALDVQQRVLGAEHPDTLSSMNNLAVMLRARGRHAEAEALHREALDVRRRVLGAEHPDTLSSMNNLAAMLRAQGMHAEAEALHREALNVQRRVLGAEHPDTLRSMNNLATTLPQQGRHAEAEALHREVLDVQRHVLGAEHPDTLSSISNLATTLQEQGRHAEAEALHREALDVRRRVLGAEHPHTLSSMNNLARVLCLQGKAAEAQALFGASGPTSHHGIGCDLCKMDPIIGVRHVSTARPDYDLCAACCAKPEAQAAAPYVALGHERLL